MASRRVAWAPTRRGVLGPFPAGDRGDDVEVSGLGWLAFGAGSTVRISMSVPKDRPQVYVPKDPGSLVLGLAVEGTSIRFQSVVERIELLR